MYSGTTTQLLDGQAISGAAGSETKTISIETKIKEISKLICPFSRHRDRSVSRSPL